MFNHEGDGASLTTHLNLTDVIFAPRDIMDGLAADHSKGSGNEFKSDWSH